MPDDAPPPADKFPPIPEPIRDAVDLLSMLWSPLAVVTANHGGARGAQIAVSAFAASIVPQRPRVLVEIQKRNHTHALIESSGRFAVSLLPEERWEWVRDLGFRSQGSVEHQVDTDKFADATRWTDGPHGLPLLADAIGTLSCRVINSMDGGDMTIFLAVVEEARRLRQDDPIRWADVRPRLPQDWVEEYGRKLAFDIPDSARRMAEIDPG
jgi:flavin reductase (DIM6/NTAB) family NADH-FMN oxidoreductase RutF